MGCGWGKNDSRYCGGGCKGSKVDKKYCGKVEVECMVRCEIKDYEELEESLGWLLKEGRDCDEEDEKGKKKKKGIDKDD